MPKFSLRSASSHTSCHGDTLAEALEASKPWVAAGGRVLSAKEVRRGVGPLRSQVRYEVLIELPSSMGTESATHAETMPAIPMQGSLALAVESALEGLLAQREEEDYVPHPLLALTQHEVPTPRRRELTEREARPATSTSPHSEAREEPDSPSWSRRRLRELGVPGAVLGALPAEDPATPAGWVRALARAIESSLPAAQRPSETCPITLSGFGGSGALVLLRALEAGKAVSTLDTGRGAELATAMKLAKAVATCV